MSIQSLSDACEIIMGQSPPSDTYNDDGEGLPFYQGKTDFGSLYPVPRKWCNKPQKIAQPNDILISVRAPVGPTNLCNSEACIGRGLAAIRSKYGISDNKYVLFYLRSIAELIESKGTGSTFQAIGRETLSNIQIPLPPLPIQKRIAAILEKADSAREKRRQTIELTEKFLQSAFLEMFGDPVTNPKGWEKLLLSEASEKITDGEHLNPPLTKEGLHIITATDVREWGIDFTRNQFVSAADFDKFTRKCKPENGDLLVVSRGATIGRCTRVGNTRQFCLMGSVILVKPKKVRSEFLQYLFRNSGFLHRLVAVSSASAQQAMYIKDISNLLIYCPPISLQLKFAALVEKVESMRTKQRTSEQELENLFQSLMQRAFKGELV